jgi:rSAM/selenodomain-associated transferase 1
MFDKQKDMQDSVDVTTGSIRADGAGLSVVVMAKAPIPGHVKTRLTKSLSPRQAAAVHAAMLECVLARLERHLSGNLVLALSEPMPVVAAADALGGGLAVDIGPCWERVEQGPGDLGERIARVWQAVGAGPAVFLGVDSPDVPTEALAAIPPALDDHDVAVGPVDDGGYWVLGARGLLPVLLHGIDWGSRSVYHQTTAAAQGASLSWATLPSWFDVDQPDDLRSLQQRLASAREPALMRLRERVATAVSAAALDHTK